MKYYIAYGSNLHKEDMSRRCPGAKAAASGALDGWRLVFRGVPGASYATVEPCEGHCVPVGIWEIDGDNERCLDMYEGYPDLYYKREITVSAPGGELTGMIYIMSEGRKHARPSDSYIRTVSEGYDDFGFDKAVLEDAIARSAGNGI